MILVKIHSAKEKLGIFRSLCGFAVNYSWDEKSTTKKGITMMKQDTVLNFGAQHPTIPEGTWPFRITQAEVERNCPTAYGIRDRVALTYVMQAEGEEHPLRQRYLASNVIISRFQNHLFS